MDEATWKAGGETRHAQQDSETRERSEGSMCESAKITVTEEVTGSCRSWPTPGRASHSHVLSSAMFLPRTACAGSVMKTALPLSRDGIMFRKGSNSTPTARERTIPSRRHMSFPWNCSSSQQPFEDRFTAESVLAHTVSCPLTQLSGGVFVKLFKASCRETEGGERVGVEEARSVLLGTICIHHEEELICAEGQSTYRICDMAPYRGGNNFSTLVLPFPELLVLDAREAWICSLLSVWVRQA